MTTSENIIYSYEEFLNEKDVYNFECDMEKGKYKDWVDTYPRHTMSIFGSLLTFNGNFVNEEDIIYFKTKGVDLNLPSKAYPSDFSTTTLLVFACERRFLGLIEVLLKQGADVNQKDPNGISPLESVLMGHRINDIYKYEEVEPVVKLLIEFNVKKEFRKFLLEQFCKEYLEKSEFLSTLLKSCKII